ncbi:hypothetical protein [Kordia sp.]|uniref:hypothetical protein n=1 Tax=Kordia sp. TaxID=1965332 RepID=UPI003D2C1F38
MPNRNTATTEDALQQSSYLHFKLKNYQYAVVLVDREEYKIIKGYGNTIIEAVNDLHSILF